MVGRTISHFRILAKIGEGRMGVVYKAEDETLGRSVALMVLPAELTGFEERRLRLVREASTAAAFNHPNIAVTYEIDEMETSVARRQGPRPFRRTLASWKPSGLWQNGTVRRIDEPACAGFL